jgi:hypothetical protein|nr:MAG TPA: Phi29 scaffolding protein [Caudoviricetes sp.]
MTYEEYEKRINDALANADTAPTEFVNILSELKTDLTAKDTLETEKTELETRVRDLQDTNMKLYLSVTGTSDEDEEEDEPAEGSAVVDELMEKLFKESEEK